MCDTASVAVANKPPTISRSGNDGPAPTIQGAVLGRGTSPLGILEERGAGRYVRAESSGTAMGRSSHRGDLPSPRQLEEPSEAPVPDDPDAQRSRPPSELAGACPNLLCEDPPICGYRRYHTPGFKTMRQRPTARRLGTSPIVSPRLVEGYGAIFNAGVIHRDGRLHLFARGVREGYRRNPGPGPRFEHYVSDILVLTSADGLTYEFQQVLASASPDEVYSYEDPRVQVVWSNDAEHTLMTYTDLPDPASGLPWRIGIQRLVFDRGRFQLDHDSRRVIDPAGYPDKDGVVFNLLDGRVALIHRIHPDMQVAVFDSLEALLDPEPGYWEAHVGHLDRHRILSPAPGAPCVGAGAPPIPTPAGLLMFFHERMAEGPYTASVALLNGATGRVVTRLPEPILTPELEWERFGDVDDVVFVQGAHRLPDGDIYLTYGAADRCVGAAVVNEADLLDALLAASRERGPLARRASV